ncbi:MAG TPA: hypothetical protein VGR26_13415 [Acidimicrobiales bacterium]|nr:hypothetical protein [Acidimicrobiales bacterium]
MLRRHGAYHRFPVPLLAVLLATLTGAALLVGAIAPPAWPQWSAGPSAAHTPVVVRNGIWYLRASNTSGVADIAFRYGDHGDRPVVGDWNGDGTDTPGVVRGNIWYLRNSNTSGVADIAFRYGNQGDRPVVGDWNNDGTDTPGVVRGAIWYLRNSNTSGVADIAFRYGNHGDTLLGEQPSSARLVHAYAGLGTWIDVFDWSRSFGKDGPLVEVADIDRMADVGVQTLYVQTSRWNAPADVLEPERLLPLIERARARGMSVVAWYLPPLVDPQADLRRLMAAAALPVDAVAVDIEPDVADVAERNRRLLWLSHELRHALPGTALGAVPYAPVAMEVINPALWPGFPWRELDTYYDVWMPMSYWSYRTAASGYRDGYRYTAENIDRLRANVGAAGTRVHPIGGIADAVSEADVAGMVRAATERGAIGGSLYDWRTTSAPFWGHLQGFRR